MTRVFIRALLSLAAAAAAIILAGCNGESISPMNRALAPLPPRLVALIKEKNMEKDSPILLRIFKSESTLEVWKMNRDGRYALLKTYPICRWSGKLGPKKKQGDLQAPEGFYTITRAQMNPNSNYYLAFNTGYPNAYDRAWGRTGSELMVHGDCSSAGCYAMTNGEIQEIYALARDSFEGGQRQFQLEAFPFRMTPLNMAKHRNNPNFAFWKMLKQGYNAFEATRLEPKVDVCNKRYVFDAVAPAGDTKPLRFNARGKCPVFRLDPTVADAILNYRRQQQYQMAQYIAQGVPVAPPRTTNGGTNPVFAERFVAKHYDDTGHVYQTAAIDSGAVSSASRTASPEATASVGAPQSTTSSQHTSSAFTGLFNHLFGGSSAQAKQPAKPATTHRPNAVRTASASGRRHPRKTEAAHAKSKKVARLPEPEPERAAKEAKKKTPPAPPIRTASHAPPSGNNGLLAGAQPVVPAGSFNARWSALMARLPAN